MRPSLWASFLALQNELVGVCGVHTCEPKHAQRAVGALRAHEARELLTIGPGGQGELAALERAAPNLSVVVIREAELEMAQTYLKERGSGGRAWMADIHDMFPLKSGSFDALFASNVLEHCFAPYMALMECRRVLRPGGLAYFVVPPFDSPSGSGGQGPYHLHCLTEAVWRELLHKTGLEVKKATTHHVGLEPCLDFVCTAVTPPAPHDRVLAKITEDQDYARARAYGDGLFDEPED